ncbi:sugar transferase [Citricoccus nitrophenolicus]|uniref:Undecaprenyl-phosphate galactose phosphotransferase WbaP/exopolysaccharide biosynthesis polyprenyl glycosylphosphotransferase n=1 Tax=Citricoccus muralis TaxID=169134 RepID=A0A3D9L9S5_9MICC|nr:sugar transferase [Citricoccus muralis]REE02396.1 Undecaprenyl-phosphate galactose phosphotransferase WbaP/exopolysaccharide biosynthesis polyprenyl glycosylphosphotransferase [Citricoccus muralis]
MSQATERVITPHHLADAAPRSSRRPSLRNPFRAFRTSVRMVPAGGLRIATPGSTVDGPATLQRTGTVPATYWRDRYRRSVLVTDVTLVVLATALGGHVSALAFTDPDRPAVVVAGVVALLWVGMLQLFRTRSARSMAVGATEYKRVLDATAATAGLFAILALLVDGTGGRYFLLIAFPAGLAGLLTGRWLWRVWLQRRRIHGCALSDVVVVGQPVDVQYVLRQIERKSGAAYRVVGVVLDGEPTSEDEAETSLASRHAPSFLGTHHVTNAVTRLQADAVIVAGTLTGGNQTIRDLGWSLEESRAELILVSSLTNVAGPRISVRPVEGLPLMHVAQPTFGGGRHLVKRTMDIAVSAVALLLMLPLFGVLALMIHRDSPGEVFFAQTRTGRRGTPFRMYKFRTMRADAEQQKAALVLANEGAGPLFKLKADPRVTRIGARLRHHSLDELPQFWNVLKGDMSLVGPRPPLPDEVAAYAGYEGRRLFIKPGLTGLWQINGRSNLGWDESVRLDLYYVENWSVTGDLQIMWRTFKVMIQPEGAY